MKTRINILTGLFLVAIGSVCAQDIATAKNNLRIEAGYAFTGSGDLGGYCFYNEYSRSIGMRFKISPAIGFLNFFRDEHEEFDNLKVLDNVNCISLDLTGYFYPVKTSKFDIETGLGVYLRNWHWIYATGPDQVMIVRGITVGPGSYYDLYVTSPGYTVSVGTILKTGSRMDFSIRGVYQNDMNGDNSVTARFGLRIGL